MPENPASMVSCNKYFIADYLKVSFRGTLLITDKCN